MPDEIEIQIAKNEVEISSLRKIWEGFQSRPNSDLDHFLHVIGEDKGVVRPHITLLLRNKMPVAMAIGRIEKYRMSCKFGYKAIYSPTVSVLGIIYDGLIGDCSLLNCDAMLNSLLQTMRLEKLDLIRFSYLRNDSFMYSLIKKKPGFLMRDFLNAPSLHWRMKVPKNIDDFLRARNRKHRYWLRRIKQVLEKEFPGQIRIKRYLDDNEIDELLLNAETVAKGTYQWGLGQGLKNSPEMRKRLVAFSRRNQLRAYILFIESRPCAFWTGRAYGNTFYLMHTGYLPEFKKHELGTILFMHLVEDLAENTNMEFVDFGFSDQAYKSRFGNESWEEETVYIFAPKWRSIKINALRTLVGKCWNYSFGLLERIGIKDKVKRIMRDRVIRNLKKNK